MEVTSQQATAAPQQASAMPTNFAPPVAPQFASSPAQTSPALNLGPMLAAQPTAQYQAATYQQAGLPQASAAQGNPWQEAFQALSASLNTSNPYQAQASRSAYQTTPTPQQVQAANWGSQASSAAPTYSPQVSTQGYSEAQVEQLVDRAIQHGANKASDAYLSQISDQSLEVLEHFGAEAPVLLNQYACAVEDALIEQVRRTQALNLLLEAAGEERAAMNLMLTDPDILADYVNDFFGPNGPYPTPTEREMYEIQQQQARQQFEAEIVAQERSAVPQAFQRPQQQMPQRSRQQNAARNFWGGFSQLMDNNPEDAWKFLSQADPRAFQSKVMIQDM